MNLTVADSEKSRLAALKEFQILDTLPEQEFDDITLLASQICETPIAAISLIDENRQWFKSQIGLDVNETPRSHAFCNYAINNEDGLFIVPDADLDSRFAANPLVTDAPLIKFYAGSPLTTSDGYKIGTLCVIDRKPRELSEAQQRALSALSRSVMSLIEARISNHSSNSINKENEPALFSKEAVTREKSFFARYVKHYITASLVILVITLIKLALGSLLQIDSPFLLFAFIVLLAAWRGGLGPGLYSTFAAAIIIDYFFIPPYESFLVGDYKQNLLFAIFIGQGVFISALCASRLRNETLLYQVGTELENRVINRTKLLAQANDELKHEIKERGALQEDLRQARDAALESARLKSEFLANMSHEIRTPMNGVIGMTGLLLETRLDTEQQRFAQIIRSSGESLLTIINDILDFSKVEAGKLELETIDFNLREAIEGTVELFSNRMREQQNELAALIYADVPLALRGDAGRIRQILTNLIGNALKFTRQGDVIVRVKKTLDTKDSVKINFSITDTGEGISKEVQEKLFQPFTQSDASTTRRYGGTGLGLSISKKLVEIMGGEIGVESETGKGSTFWFNITLEKQSAAISALQAESFPNSKFALCVGELSEKRVLIVDDNEVNREVLTHQTRAWKMNAREAQSGLEALSLINDSNERFDLIILDLQMPEVDGIETARRIVSKYAADQILPPSIIMISSSSLKVSRETMRENGIAAFLHKPYRQYDLLETICQTLGIIQNNTSNEPDIHISVIEESFLSSQTMEKPKRILIVEDNTVNQMVAQSLLKKFGYSADVAANGREALEALEIIPYDLILMDCQMPEIDGYEATRQIRARDWEAAKTPIIALTAHATAGEREICLQAGMDDYISKPIEKENLRKIIAQWLAKTENKSPADSSGDSLSDAKNLIENSESFASAVDLSVLDEITDNNVEMRREVVEMYLAQTVTQLAEIEQAISTDNAVQLHQTAHKIVGGSSLCGMNAIVEPLRKLEQLGREGNTDAASPFFAQAQNAFAAIDRECRRILEN